MRGKTQSAKYFSSSHSSACGWSSFSTNAPIDSRSRSCSSVKMKCFLLALKSGFRTSSVVASAATLAAESRKRNSLLQCLPNRTTQIVARPPP